MVKEDYLDSDDIEVATLYANIIYQEKGKEYLIEALKDKKYFIYNDSTENIKLQKRHGRGFYSQISLHNTFKLEKFDRERIMETFSKMFKNL